MDYKGFKSVDIRSIWNADPRDYANICNFVAEYLRRAETSFQKDLLKEKGVINATMTVTPLEKSRRACKVKVEDKSGKTLFTVQASVGDDYKEQVQGVYSEFLGELLKHRDSFEVKP